VIGSCARKTDYIDVLNQEADTSSARMAEATQKRGLVVSRVLTLVTTPVTCFYTGRLRQQTMLLRRKAWLTRTAASGMSMTEPSNSLH
jgi:hypothetical protein